MSDRIPTRLEGHFDHDPNRVGRRMIWKFTFSDGSTWATYNSKKGFAMADLMMKARVAA